MSYLTIKYIKGHPYLYEVRSERDGDKVRQVFVRYLGRADSAEGIRLQSTFSGAESSLKQRRKVASVKLEPEPVEEPEVPKGTPIIEGLQTEYTDLINQASQIAPDNEVVVKAKELISGITPENQRQSLIQIKALEDELKGIITPEPVVTPEAPAVGEVVEAITFEGFSSSQEQLIKGMVNKLPFDVKSGVRGFRINKDTRGEAEYLPSGIIEFKNPEELTKMHLGRTTFYHEMGHNYLETLIQNPSEREVIFNDFAKALFNDVPSVTAEESSRYLLTQAFREDFSDNFAYYVENSPRISSSMKQFFEKYLPKSPTPEVTTPIESTIPVYRVDSKTKTSFKPNEQGGIWFTNKETAQMLFDTSYAEDKVTSKIHEAYLDIKNPYRTHTGESAFLTKERIDELKAQGYDSVISEEETVVFDSSQILSKPSPPVEATPEVVTPEVQPPVTPTEVAPEPEEVVEEINLEELEMGTKIELEHTDDSAIARQIAEDHLKEIPDYYTRLTKMEKEAGIEPVTPEPVEEPEVSVAKEDKYLYHGTTQGALRKILSEGIKPTAMGQVSLSSTEQYAETYVERKGGTRGILLRIRDEGQFIPDERITEAGDFLTKEIIRPEDIEVKMPDGSWSLLVDVEAPIGVPELKAQPPVTPEPVVTPEVETIPTTEPKIVWVDSWRDIPSPTVKAGKVGSTVRAYSDPNTNTIYAIKGVTTKSELEHEKYHNLKGHIDKPEDPAVFARDELEAYKYAYENIGQPRHIVEKLRAILNDLTIYTYEVEPEEALSIFETEFNKVNPPETWKEDFSKLKKEFIDVYGSKSERITPKPVKEAPPLAEGITIQPETPTTGEG